MPYIHSQNKPGTGAPAGLFAGGMLSEGGGCCSLTGLNGLDRFYGRGIPIVDRCLAEGIPCAVALISVDHFHRVSETYPPGVVEAVVKMIAHHLGAIGQSHLTGRLADDEFALLLVGMDCDGAAALCEALRRDIASSEIRTDRGSTSVTVSIGVAEVHEPETFDNYLNAAEQFLFMAKNNGRNQVLSDHIMLTMM